MLHSLEKHTGLNLKNIRIDDKDTMEMIRTGKTCGVPGFGTPFIKGLIRSTDVGCFDDLIRIHAMSHGTGVWEHNAEYIIEDNIAGLADVICYREDAMRYLLTKGYDSKKAFQISERTRKGRGLQEEEIAEMRKNQVPEWYIDSCQMIKYAFPKAHCVDYVGQAYRLAYYKAHYPLEFYSTWFNMYIDFFEIEFLGKSIQELENLLNKLQGNMDPDFIEERIDIDIIR
ncbi:MAG: PolC-type DNA polymerase III, partial [Clostridia bacterium]|nr:PolC-type DNA polymerase III [Clostridia bacterium]